jgi:hypothetical protein
MPYLYDTVTGDWKYLQNSEETSNNATCPKEQLAQWIQASEAAKAQRHEAQTCNCDHCKQDRRQKQLSELDRLQHKIIRQGQRDNNVLPLIL